MNGVSERPFILDDIPGLVWSPADATGSRPLVLLGRGGGQDKKVQGLVACAHRYVATCGFAGSGLALFNAFAPPARLCVRRGC
ncbi:hypothetical protein [Nonomuraea basaltis]|uniref:hypothetical protein n=1 Tax=Nonomuraea basaltis TaxID=2495887 RepID=UPI001486B67B|nr:hypothetical protein [Nonomuraea basaltis]